MKKTNILFSILAFILFSFQSNAQKFEGTITYKSTDKEGLNAVFTIKNHMVKMVSTTEEGLLTMITNKRTGDRISLMDTGEEKKGFKQNPANDPSKFKKSLETPKENTDLKINISEETKKIGDYNCYKATTSNELMEVEAWVTKDLNLSMTDLFASVDMKKQEQDAYKKAFGKDGFIMEMKEKDLKSEKETTLTATIEKVEIDDEVFTVPSDYEITDLTNIQDLMKDAGGSAEKLKEIRKALMKSRQGN